MRSLAFAAVNMFGFDSAEELLTENPAVFLMHMRLFLGQGASKSTAGEGIAFFAVNMSAKQLIALLRMLVRRNFGNHAGKLAVLAIAGFIMYMDEIVDFGTDEVFLVVVAGVVVLMDAQRFVGAHQFVMIDFTSLNQAFLSVDMRLDAAKAFALLRNSRKNQCIGGAKNDNTAQGTYDSFP